MSATAALMTELEAVNTMLSVISEAPVNDLEDTGLVDVAFARSILTEVSRDVQGEGWEWNTDSNVELPLTADGEILIPLDALSVDPDNTAIRASIRAGKLWNKRENTFVWQAAPRVTIKRFLQFADLPQPARHYITTRAARTFADRTIGATKAEGFSPRDEGLARLRLLQDEADQGDYNMANAGPAAALAFRWPVRGS